MITHTSRILRALALGVGLFVTVDAVEAANNEKTAIKAGRIITQAGEDIENGVIVIEHGRITQIGAGVEVPWDAKVIDASELVAFPGFVEAHTNRGMDRTNENIDVAPFLSVRDSIDPVNFYFEDSLRWGVTTINVQQGSNCVVAAQGLVVKPHGMTVEDMLVKSTAGIKLSAAPKSGLSGATQAQKLREAFDELRRYLEGIIQDKKDGGDKARREALFQGRDLEGDNAKGRAMEGKAWKVEGLDIIPRGEIDEKQEPLLALVEGEMPAFFYCRRPMEVHRALEVAEENGFLHKTTLVVESGCWKAVDAIKSAGVPVVLQGSLVSIERDPIDGTEKETFVPKVFHDAGVTFALSSTNSTTQSLWYQAANAVGLGLDRDLALDAVTTQPAAILGLEKRVGTLEKGKEGNVVLFSGDPLSVQSFVEHVVIEGEHVYDRSKDIRVQHLLQGGTLPGTGPMGAAEGDGEPPHEHGDEHDDEEEKKDRGED